MKQDILTELKSWAITMAFILFAILIGTLMIVYMASTANATDRSGPTNPTPTTYSAPTGNSNDDTTRDFALGAIAVAVLLCVAPSVWHLLKTGKWEWCWEDTKPEPLPDPGPAVKNDVTPDPVSPNQLYMIEVR